MSRLLIASSMVGILFAAAGGPTAGRLQAAGQAVKPAAAAAAPRTAPDRALLDKYCLTCHNDRLKTAGFTLEHLDVADAHANSDVLEKIVRKLRSGQMPPQG